MTKKRFENHDNIILDSEGEPLKSIDEIVDVLNELDGENDFLYDNIIKFEKENERIKKVLDTHLNKSYAELNKFESLENPSNPERVRKQIIIRDAEIMLLIRILQEIDSSKIVNTSSEDKPNKIFIQSQSIKPEHGGNFIL